MDDLEGCEDGDGAGAEEEAEAEAEGMKNAPPNSGRSDSYGGSSRDRF